MGGKVSVGPLFCYDSGCLTSATLMPSPIDLHSHSTASDGLLTPAELVRHAAAHGVRVLALTDHDDTSGLEEASIAASVAGINLINGVEISVTWKGRTIHIVGLQIDPEYAPLKEGLSNLRSGRLARAEGMAASLSRTGIQNSLEGAYSYVTRGIISRTHFARFLVEQGYAKDFHAVFKRFLVKGKPGYFEHHWAEMEDALDWITGSGGVAVIAHPGRYDLGRTNLQQLFEDFCRLGGTGVEVVTGNHSRIQYQEFARLSRQFGLLASKGSDYHGPGHPYIEMGSLPDLPEGCTPVWQDWAETAAIV